MTHSELSTADSWVDIAAPSCSLPTTAKPLRLAEFDALLGRETVSVERLTSTGAVFVLPSDPSIAGEAAELSSREAQCCSFFEFTLTITSDGLALRVQVPEPHTDILDALVERAQAPISQRST